MPRDREVADRPPRITEHHVGYVGTFARELVEQLKVLGGAQTVTPPADQPNPQAGCSGYSLAQELLEEIALATADQRRRTRHVTGRPGPGWTRSRGIRCSAEPSTPSFLVRAQPAPPNGICRERRGLDPRRPGGPPSPPAERCPGLLVLSAEIITFRDHVVTVRNLVEGPCTGWRARQSRAPGEGWWS